jgi:hypothetical protein
VKLSLKFKVQIAQMRKARSRKEKKAQKETGKGSEDNSGVGFGALDNSLTVEDAVDVGQATDPETKARLCSSDETDGFTLTTERHNVERQITEAEKRDLERLMGIQSGAT